MTLRCPCPVALVGAVVAVGFSLGLQPAPTHAASVNPNASTSPVTADYRLINVGSSLPAPDPSQAPQVVALVTPTGGIVPPTLADGTRNPAHSPPRLERVRLESTRRGVEGHDVRRRPAPADVRAGVLRPGPSNRRGAPFCSQHRQLPGQQPPALQSQTPGIVIVADPPASAQVGAGDGGGTVATNGGRHETPEPLSVVLWSAVLVGVAARRHLLRRSRPV